MRLGEVVDLSLARRSPYKWVQAAGVERVVERAGGRSSFQVLVAAAVLHVQRSAHYARLWHT